MDAETKAYLDEQFADMKAGIDQRFDAVDRRFDRLETTLGEAIELIQALTTGTSARFDALERKGR
jgi:hypothetical protein